MGVHENARHFLASSSRGLWPFRGAACPCCPRKRQPWSWASHQTGHPPRRHIGQSPSTIPRALYTCSNSLGLFCARGGVRLTGVFVFSLSFFVMPFWDGGVMGDVFVVHGFFVP